MSTEAFRTPSNLIRLEPFVRDLRKWAHVCVVVLHCHLRLALAFLEIARERQRGLGGRVHVWFLTFSRARRTASRERASERITRTSLAAMFV